MIRASMRIRWKLVLVVLPLIITPLLLVSLAASLAARNGITRVATDFLQFKADELANYAQSQWNLLAENGLEGNPEFVAVAKAAVESFARSLVRRDSELILAVEPSGNMALKTAEVQLQPAERAALAELASSRRPGWLQLRLGGEARVGQGLRFQPFDWYLLVTEQRSSFYRAVQQISYQSVVILTCSLASAVALLVVFIRYLTQPMGQIAEAMKQIISAGDLTRRVELEYRDEVGELGHTFNLMTGELEKAHNQIKSYAFRAVVAQKKEQKIRHIFQKYVPAEVIDQFFSSPEAMLVGDKRELAVMFTDIRGFTTISEKLPPEEIVESLNAYFGPMVEVVQSHGGIVDKYIGDAIMAFFGAPVKHDNDALQAVNCGFGMLEALAAFNSRQRQRGKAPFTVGIGINYGEVTVGNIGSDKKMDYTVIGDMVNLASRLEGLTKLYRVPFLISEPVYRLVTPRVRCRLADRVVVKGKTESTAIYVPCRRLSAQEAQGWKFYSAGVDSYFQRAFGEAVRLLAAAQQFMPDDTLTQTFLARARLLDKEAPGPDWTGITVVPEK
jgi:class 3 adenylate cyclase/HAMP domain-containing protein